LQDELIDERENGRISADAESQGQHGHDAEQGRFAKSAERVTEILREGSNGYDTGESEKSYAPQ
jgi:hypothetical protein